MATADRPVTRLRPARIWAGVRADLGAVGLIAVAVMVTMRDTVVYGRVSNADAVALWLPVWTFLGRALRAGHIPLWQPSLMGGAPFAADAQSGWGYLEPMILFTVLPPAEAIRVMVVLQPLTAAIGLYCLLRIERLPRWAACCGGLVLGLAITASTLGDALPFSASLAWTVLTLLACSRLLAARTWARRLVWMVPTAIAWGQIAAAHAGLGLLMGSISVIAYVIGKLVMDVRVGRRGPGAAVAVAGILAASGALVNLAYFAPRLAYVDETSLGLGYGKLKALGRVLAHIPPSPYYPGNGASLTWPLKLAIPPGAYLGGAALIAVFLAFRSKYRRLAWTFAGVTVVVYVGSLSHVTNAIPRSFDQLLPVDLYLHAPWWLGYEMVLSMAVLAAVGLAAWPSATTRARRGAGIAAVLVWIVAPILLGMELRAMVTATVGIAVALVALEVTRRRPRFLWVVPCVLAVELVAATFAPQYHRPIAVGAQPPRLTPPAWGTRDIDPVILDTSPFQKELTRPGTGRVLPVDTAAAARAAKPDGIINQDTEPSWLLNWPLLSGAQSVAGYEAVELKRYWVIIRVLGGTPANYEHANFRKVPHKLSNLLRVEWVIRPTAGHPVPGEVLVARAGRFKLFRRPSAPAAVSLIGTWHAVAGPVDSLRFVRRIHFHPNSEAVIEAAPAMGSGGKHSSAGTAHYVSTGEESATVDVRVPRRQLLLIRTPYASGWHATIDGAPTPLVPTDYIDQGVVVPRGHHVVRLTFTDPWVVRGLVGSVLAIAALLLAAGAAAIYARRPSPDRPAWLDEAVTEPDRV